MLRQLVMMAILLAAGQCLWGQYYSVYTNRAQWEAALLSVVNQNLESVAQDFDLAAGTAVPSASTTVATHTFTGSYIDLPTGVLLDVPPLQQTSLFPNSTQISWSGTTGARPRLTVSIPAAHGIAFDWKCTSTSQGLHNSLYFSVVANGTPNTVLLNLNITSGFFGIIYDCSTISSYTIYSDYTNFQKFSVDNFAYGSHSFEYSDIDMDGTPDCFDGCAHDPNKTAPGQCGCLIEDIDNDGDNYYACNDCDDSNPDVHPNATEDLYNGIDDDCEGTADQPMYCTPQGNCQNGFLTNMQINGQNLSQYDVAGCNGYILNTNVVPSLQIGVPHTVTLTAQSIAYCQARVYIDWDKDGAFNAGNETIFQGVINNPAYQNTGTRTFTFTIPSNTSLSYYRMRVVVGWVSSNPCSTENSEIEDYSILVVCSDLDGDGITGEACGGTDCNDNDNSIYPGAVDICDNKDNDCDGQTDEGGSGTPSGWSQGNVGGAINAASQFSCSSGSQSGIVYTLSSQGFSSQPGMDIFNSNYMQKCGNTSITAHLTGSPSPGWAGIYIRENLTAGSRMAALKTNLNSALRREVRTTTGGSKVSTQNPVYGSHSWLRIKYNGGQSVSFYSSPNGTDWVFFGATTISMGSCVYVGLFVESINNSTLATASFDNVQVVTTAGYQLAAAPDSGAISPQEQLDAVSFDIYPNPTTGELNVDLAHFQQTAVQIRVLSPQGQLLQSVNYEEAPPSAVINLQDCPAGVYYVGVKSAGIPETFRRAIRHGY